MKSPIAPTRVRTASAPRAALAAITAALLVVSLSCGGTTAAVPASAASAAPAAPASAAAPATSKPTESEPTAANPVTVTIGFPVGTHWSPFYVGVEKGIFLKHGIDLKIKTLGSVQEGTKALQANEIQISPTAWVTTVPAVVQGVPLRVIAMLTGRPDKAVYDTQLAIVARAGAGTGTGNAGLASLKSLKIAATFGGNGEAYVRSVLRNAGLNPDKDVTLINSTQSNMQALMQSVAVDAAGPTEPYGSVIVATMSGSRIVIQGGGTTDSRSMVVAMDPWIKANPVVLDRYLAAQFEATQYLRRHPDETGVAASHYIAGVEATVIANALRKLSFDPRWSSTVLEGIETSGQELLANGTVKALPKSSDILFLDTLTTSEKKYAEYFSDLK